MYNWCYFLLSISCKSDAKSVYKESIKTSSFYLIYLYLMSFNDQLDAIISKYNLLYHPFYQAWSAGTLPVESLKQYASDYGLLIKLMPDAWNVLEDYDTAHEEEEHLELREEFADTLDTKLADTTDIPQISSLVETAARLFKEPATALGALYAFEVQQPATAQSKLDGLKKRYTVGERGEEYFVEHSHNEHEAEKLLVRINACDAATQVQVLASCQTMCQSMRNGLSGLYDQCEMKS